MSTSEELSLWLSKMYSGRMNWSYSSSRVPCRSGAKSVFSGPFTHSFWLKIEIRLDILMTTISDIIFLDIFVDILRYKQTSIEIFRH